LAKERNKKLSSVNRRAQILDAARMLFAKKGYNETTLDDIANRVGVSRTRVIQLFGSKQGVYEAIAEIAYQSHPLDQDLEAPIKERNDFAVFKAFASHILQYTSKRRDREIFKILMYARLKEDHFHRAHFHKKDTLMISRLSDYVRERITEGALRPVDYRTVIYAYQAMISNLAIYKNVLKEMGFVSIDRLSSDCARIFLEGLVNSGEPLKRRGSKRGMRG